MAKPNDLGLEIVQAVDDSPAAKQRRERNKARRVEALSLILAGFTYDQIAERLDISQAGARDLVNRTLLQAENSQAELLRELENARLDRAQAGIWTQVIGGDLKAVDTFLRISARRSRLNGLDAPTKINLSVNVRQEMESALTALENVVLGEVIARDDTDAAD